MFVEFDVVVELFILTTHLLSDIVQQVAKLFPSFVEAGTGLINILIFQRLKLSDTAFQELDFFYAAELTLSF